MILFTYTYITYILLYIYNTYSVFIIAPFPKEPLISHIFYTYLYTRALWRATNLCKTFSPLLSQEPVLVPLGMTSSLLSIYVLTWSPVSSCK